MTSSRLVPVIALLAICSELPVLAQRSLLGRPIVRFDALGAGGPAGDVEYYKRHLAEGYGQVDLTMRASGAIPPAGLHVSYDVSGDAVEGVHYEIVAGSESPLFFASGQDEVPFAIRILGGTQYFDERQIVLRIRTDQLAVPAGDADELRLYVRSVTPPPQIQFKVVSSTGGIGVQSIIARIRPNTSDSAELVRLYWRQSNVGQPAAAVEGVDYAWFPGGESGSRTIDIAGGQTFATIPFEVLPTATDGRVLELALDHELSDRSNENAATFSNDFRLESPDKVSQLWPGDPTDYVSGPASVVGQGPVPVTLVVDPLRVHPDTGEPLTGLILAKGAAGPGYHRKSFENEVHCGGPLQLLPLPRYTRWSVYVDLPELVDPVQGYSRFVRISMRDRVTDKNHAVVFDRESTDGGLLGSAVSTPTGEWGVFTTGAWNAFSSFGVELENGRTRLWLLYRELDDLKLGNVTSRIMYPLWFGPDGTSNLVGGTSQNIGKGLLFYDSYLELSDSPLAGAPGRYWEKRGNWWAPRGRASLVPGGKNTHTFTIEVP